MADTTFVPNPADMAASFDTRRYEPSSHHKMAPLAFPEAEVSSVAGTDVEPVDTNIVPRTESYDGPQLPVIRPVRTDITEVFDTHNSEGHLGAHDPLTNMEGGQQMVDATEAFASVKAMANPTAATTVLPSSGGVGAVENPAAFTSGLAVEVEVEAEAEAEGEAADLGWDPGEYTVDEVKADLGNYDLDQLQALRTAEVAGKNRAGVLDAVDLRIEEIDGPQPEHYSVDTLLAKVRDLDTEGLEKVRAKEVEGQNRKGALSALDYLIAQRKDEGTTEVSGGSDDDLGGNTGE